MKIRWHWLQQLRNRWIRGRQGWCPEDVWSLDVYLAQVLAGSLKHLAATTNGVPAGYPHLEETLPADIVCINSDSEQWTADLRRWAADFDRYVAYFDCGVPEDPPIEQTLKEMAPWFGSLWD